MGVKEESQSKTILVESSECNLERAEISLILLAVASNRRARVFWVHLVKEQCSRGSKTGLLRKSRRSDKSQIGILDGGGGFSL